MQAAADDPAAADTSVARPGPAAAPADALPAVALLGDATGDPASGPDGGGTATTPGTAEAHRGDPGWQTGLPSPFAQLPERPLPSPGPEAGDPAPPDAPGPDAPGALAPLRAAARETAAPRDPAAPGPAAEALSAQPAGLSTEGLWNAGFLETALAARGAGAPHPAGSGGVAGGVVGALTGGSYLAWAAGGGAGGGGVSADDFTGAGQTIVVIDDGFSRAYDQSNLVFHYDFRGNDPSAEESTRDSHGSWVAQIAVREAPAVGIIHLQVMRPDGFASPDDIEEALAWVVGNAEKYDVAAVNLSIGYGSTDEVVGGFASDEYAALDALGVLVVVAAGNDGRRSAPGVNMLAADGNAIAVSAVDQSDRVAGFTQHAPGLTDIFALGENVEVRQLSGAVESIDGTSFAAPYVSAIAALLQEAAETLIGERLTDEEFLEILQVSARPLNTTAPVTDPGYRVADAEAALDYFIANAALYDDDPLTA